MPQHSWVNAHTHLELGVLADMCPEGLAFPEWVSALIRRRMQLEERDFRAGIEAGIAALIEAGTVAVGDIAATGFSVEPLLQSGLAGVVYLEVLGFDPQVALERLHATQHLIDGYRRRAGRMQVGLTIHAPYSCAPELFQAAAAWCRAEQVPLAIHLAESPAEVEFLLHGSGPLYALNQRITPHVRWTPPGCSPVQYLERLDVLAARPVLIHCVQVDDADLALLQARGCPVVHCPRSNDRLLTGRMPLERYLELEIPVALGTDSLASAPSLDVRDELEYALTRHAGLVGRDALTHMATSGGAAVLGIAGEPVR